MFSIVGNARTKWRLLPGRTEAVLGEIVYRLHPGWLLCGIGFVYLRLTDKAEYHETAVKIGTGMENTPTGR